MTTSLRERKPDTFRHEALVYAGRDDFVSRVAPFIRDGVVADEPTLVVVDADKIELLRSHLGPYAAGVRFADMAIVGRNPARIIPEWRAFVDEYAASGRPFRGVGEPIWAARTPDQLVECERHEALLNLAFADGPAWWLVCPYDRTTLPPSVLEEAERNHPFVADNGAERELARFRGLDEVQKPFDRPLPLPKTPNYEMSFRQADLGAVRRFTAHIASSLGLGPDKVQDFVLVVDEVATNSIRYGGGQGHLRMWSNGPTVVAEIKDAGRIDDPLVGRHRPAPNQRSGFGLWAANQLCDLVQVRTLAGSSVVRLHMSRS